MAEVYEHVTTSHLDELATAMTANHPNCASVRFFFSQITFPFFSLYVCFNYTLLSFLQFSWD